MLIKTFYSFTLKFKEIFLEIIYRRDFPLSLREFPWNMLELAGAIIVEMRVIISQMHHLTKIKCYDRSFPNKCSISTKRTGLLSALAGFTLESLDTSRYVSQKFYKFSGVYSS